MEFKYNPCSGIEFDLETKVRSGQAGTFVYKGALNGSPVAVKRIPNEKNQLFRREADLLESLDHPNIMKLVLRPHTDSFDGNAYGCLVMPWCEEDLSKFLAAPQTMSPLEIITKLMLPIAQGLAYAHEREKTHRDLKPSNVLIEDGGAPVIADFGVGKNLAASNEETIGAFTSYGYTPDLPGDGLQHDVYSFGVIALELLCGRVIPSVHERRLVLEGLDIRQDLVFMLRRCLEDLPQNRFRSMVEVAENLTTTLRTWSVSSGQNQGLMTLTRRFKEEFASLTTASSGSVEKRLKTLLEGSAVQIRPIGDEDGSFRIDDFCLYIDEFEVRLKGDPATGITHATRCSDLQGNSKRRPPSMPLFPIQWRVLDSPQARASPPTSNEIVGYRKIRAAVENWVDNGRPEDGQKTIDKSVENLIDEWSRILNATEDVLTGDGEGIKYFDYYMQDTERSFVFRTEFDFEGNLEDTSWEIQGVKNSVGVVTVHQGTEVELNFPYAPSAKFPKNGELRRALDSGTQTAIKRKRDALSALAKGTAVNPRLGSLLSAASNASPPRSVKVDEWINPDLDEPKRAAVELALGSENFALVQGPPGTGKTEFIVELIGQILNDDPSASILLVSQTHVALDNALARLRSGGVTNKVARLGNPESKQISAESISLLPENQIAEWSKSLTESTWRYSSELAMDAGLTPPTAVGLTNLLRIRSILEQIKVLEDAIQDDLIPQNAEELNPRINNLRLEVRRATELLREQLPELEPPKTIDDVEYSIKALGNSLTGDLAVLEILTMQARWISKILVSDELETLFLRSRSVLAGTCIGFLSNPAVKNLEFDYCILDEASRANPAESLVPFTKSKRMILVGDSRQLGPSSVELAGQTAILQKNKITPQILQDTLFKYLESELPAHSQVSLDIQYRMANPIGELISMCFYEGRIKSRGPGSLLGLNFIAREGSPEPYYPPLRWVDTSYLTNKKEERSHKSIFNTAEAELIVGQIRALSRSREFYSLRQTPLRILVTSPYAAQISKIRNLLDSLPSLGLTIEVLSIDSIQGREADLVFFSPVRSNQNPNDYGFITPERINVALSRARHSLVIVGDASFWQAGTTKLGEIYDAMQKLPSHICEIVVEN